MKKLQEFVYYCIQIYNVVAPNYTLSLAFDCWAYYQTPDINSWGGKIYLGSQVQMAPPMLKLGSKA